MALHSKFLSTSLFLIMPLFLAACFPDASADKSSKDAALSDDVVTASRSVDGVASTIEIPTSISTKGTAPASLASKLVAVTELATDKAEAVQEWSVSASSKDLHFDGILKCQAAPVAGDFQNCRFELYQQGKAVDGAQLAIDGGMKTHGHGLPTKPTLVSVGNQTGEYIIEGLKFSMAGEWTIGFLIQTSDVSDQLLFDFTI